MQDFSKKLKKQIADSDPERLTGYIDSFDRLLLYTIASGSIPPDIMFEIVSKWERGIKMSIDMESQLRTNYLESTPQGRLAKKQKEPDGEDLRLLFSNTLTTAKEIVTRNLEVQENKNGHEGFDSSDF